MISRLSDLIGMGECLRHIKELILWLLQTYLPSEEKKIELEIKRLQAQTLEIQNAGLVLAYSAEHGCSSAEVLLLTKAIVSRQAFQPQEERPGPYLT